MKYTSKITVLILVCWFALNSIGAVYIPPSAYTDSIHVKCKVELHTIEYLNQSLNTTEGDLIKHHNAIVEMAEEECTEAEISELEDLFQSFLKSRSEDDLKLYTEKVTENILGKPNFIMFFLLIIAIVGYVFFIPIKKKVSSEKVLMKNKE